MCIRNLNYQKKLNSTDLPPTIHKNVPGNTTPLTGNIVLQILIAYV